MMDSVNKQNSQHVQYLGVRFSPNRIAQLDKKTGKQVKFIPKEKIRRIRFKKGWHSDRPFLQITFGAILSLTGLYYLGLFLFLLLDIGTFYARPLRFLLLVLPLGIWALWDGLKKGFYFEILVRDGKRKIALFERPKKDEFREFITAATRLGYSVNVHFEEILK